MLSPGLAVVPCLWAVWTFLGVIIMYTMTIIGGHYKTPLLSISDIGANKPESLVFIIVFTISNLLEAVIIYIIYKLMELKTTDNELSKPIWRRMLLALGWTSCIGSMIALHIQDKSVSDYMQTALFFVDGLNYIFQAIPFYEVSRDSAQKRATKMVISIIMFIIFITTSTLKATIITLCTSETCIQVSTITSNILEWVSLFGSIVGNILLYNDFQLLTIKFQKNIKEDWIVIREDLYEACNNTEEPDPEKMEPRPTSLQNIIREDLYEECNENEDPDPEKVEPRLTSLQNIIREDLYEKSNNNEEPHP